MCIKVFCIVLNKLLDILFHCHTSQMTIGRLLKLKEAESSHTTHFPLLLLQTVGGM